MRLRVALRLLSSLLAGWISLCVLGLQTQPAQAQTTIYATAGKVFRSTDGGITWTATNSLFFGAQALAVDPTNPDTIYAGTGGAGIFKSTDAGASWASINTGLAPTHVDALTIDPTNPATIYAASNIFFGNGGAFKSTNGGASWSGINNGLPSSDPTTGAALSNIHAAAPNTLYIGFAGAFKTADAGANWLSVGVPSGFALAIDPASPATIYSVGGFGGISKSVDEGLSWSNITPVGQGIIFVFSLAIDPAVTSTLYIGTRVSCESPTGICGAIFESTNSGVTWQAIFVGPPSESPGTAGVEVLAVDPVNTSTLYAAGRGFGFFRTTDGGTNWTAVDGLEDIPAALAFAPPPLFLQVQTLASMVRGLAAPTGPLNSGQADSLVKKLALALAQFTAGRTNVVCNLLGAFVNQVHDYVAEGRLTPEEGDSLTFVAEAISNLIPCAG